MDLPLSSLAGLYGHIFESMVRLKGKVKEQGTSPLTPRLVSCCNLTVGFVEVPPVTLSSLGPISFLDVAGMP